MVVERAVDVDSVRFAYAVAGTGSPVVLLPGGGGWRLTFAALMGTLATHHTVYALDPPGQGGTRVLDSMFGYDVDAIAHSIDSFVQAMGLVSAAFVGHSWGGGFALRLAQLRPGRVDRLALLAPGGLDEPDVWELRAMRLPLLGELALRFTSTTAVRHMARKSFAHQEHLPSPELMRDAARQLRIGPDAATLRRDMLRVERGVHWRDTERDLGLVRCPTTILWGELDRIFPVSLLERFTRRLPMADGHVVPGCGHSLPDDCPERVKPLLTRFLAAH